MKSAIIGNWRALNLFAITMCGAIMARGTSRAEVSPEPGQTSQAAPKPLYRDRVYDGAADPVVVWNGAERKWCMLYTNRRANVPGLRGVSWVHGTRLGIAESTDAAQLVRDLGFDSVTSYVWIHHVELPQQQTDYDFVRDAYFEYWDKAEKKFTVPYFPNVTMGWDSSPRANQDDEFGNFRYPFMNTISGNTPERFRAALQLTKQRLLARPNGPRILNINCWNEWTEGSYLEPDTMHGMQYLEAIRDVLGSP
jgi:hypothetical protein